MLYIFFLQTDFLYLKITNIYEQETIRYEDFGRESKQAFNRFGSLFVDLEDIKSDPLFGKGLTDDIRFYQHSNFSRSNSISDFAVKFGLIGFIFMFYKTIYVFYSF